LGGKDIKVVYDDPWFWKISANRWSNNNNQIRESNAIHEDVRRNVRRGGPRIEFEDEVRQDDRRPSIDRRDDRRDDRRRDDTRRDDRYNEVRPSEARRDDRKDDRRPNEVRRDDRRPSEARRDDRRDDRRPSEARRNDKQTEVFVPVIKEEPMQSAAEIAQLAIINSTKKRKIILKKKESQPKVELVVVEEVKEENA